MPTDEETLEHPEPEPPAEPEKPKETPPAAIALTQEQLTGIVREAASSATQASMRALMAERVAHGADTTPIDDVSDADLETAIAQGGGSAAAIRKAIKAEAERLARNRIDPAVGIASRSLRNLAVRAAKADMPHYDRFKKEIDQAVANLPPDKAGDPDTIVDIHDYLVGKNWKALQEEARRGWEQEREKPKPTQTGGGRGAGNLRAVPGKSGSRSGKLAPEDVFSPDALASLADLGKNKNGRPVGKSFEDFCRDVLGKEPDEYLAEVAKDEGLETGS